LKKFLDGHSHPYSQRWTASGSIYHKLEVTSHGGKKNSGVFDIIFIFLDIFKKYL
jgi:hypothetical protein